MEWWSTMGVEWWSGGVLGVEWWSGGVLGVEWWSGGVLGVGWRVLSGGVEGGVEGWRV